MKTTLPRLLGAVLLAVVLPLGFAVPAHAEDSVALVPKGNTRPYKVINANSQKFIAIHGASPAHGAAAVQHNYTAQAPTNDQMRFEWQGNNSNWFRIKPVHTYSPDGVPHNDKCLAVQGAAYNDGAHVNNYDCTYGDNVHNDVWLAELAQNSDGLTVWWETQFRNLRSGKCLVVNGASRNTGVQLVQHTCNGTTNGLWTVQTL